MSSLTLFRAVLIAGLFFTVISVAAGLALIDTLPLILQNYLKEVEEGSSFMNSGLFFLFIMVGLMVLIISIIGLWKFRPWARTLYVLIAVIYLPFQPFIGPVVMNGWESTFYDISLMLEGILFAMMFFGESSQKFKRQV